jgi:5-methyltetrahydrofolate--homocysteine methyltransferase
MHLFDGAMGTMLQKYGLPAGECPELFSLTHGDLLTRIHREYAEAGSEILITNTFGAHPLKLADYHLEDKVEELAYAAVANIRKAAGDRVKAAGDMGPTGSFIAPLGDRSFDEVADGYFRLAGALARAGADYIIIETIIDIQEMRAALTGAKAACDLPVICQMSFSDDGRTITGTDPASAVILLDAMGADIIGANCSLGPDQLLPLARIMVKNTNKPIVIQPNAGIPFLDNGVTRFPLTPEDMARAVPLFAEAGVEYMGGCCGTTPEHIRAMKEAVDRISTVKRKETEPFTALTSRVGHVCIGDGFAPVMIGERINPTGRKKLREDIQAGRFTSVKKEALDQIDAGADILDVNMGVPGISQAEAMEKAVSQISMFSSAPLSIDSTDPEVVEAALKVYPGRPLINSVNADPEQLEAILPLAKRFGAAVLCLPLGRKGIPKTAEERVEVIRRILEAAYAAGLRHEDLLLDPLVMTIASDDAGGRETLRTIRLYKENFGLPCVMGTSNVSFGLPGRPQVNAAFLSMALACGMNAPIVNPMDELIQKAFMTGRLLLGYDPHALHYIASADTQSVQEVRTQEGKGAVSHVERIHQAVVRGEKESIPGMVEEALQFGTEPMSIIQDGLTAAMQDIGEAYGRGRAYLPQVMLAAETMQNAFTALKKFLPDLKTESKGTILLATVQGDIHDLGKNIVHALLENNGYRIIDLGKDVAPEKLIQEIQKNPVDAVGLCSLMTTTLPRLSESVQAVKELNSHIKVIVGGAVVTKDYARQAGADAYAKDGIEAVRRADELLGGGGLSCH